MDCGGGRWGLSNAEDEELAEEAEMKASVKGTRGSQEKHGSQERGRGKTC